MKSIQQMREEVARNISAKMISHSIGPHGITLATMEVCMPRMVLAEFNTHRVFDRNSASSRAIPIEKQLRMIFEKPYLPFFFGANQSGMQAVEELTGDDLGSAIHNFNIGRYFAVMQAVALMGGVTKLKDKYLVEKIDNVQANYFDLPSIFFRSQSVGLHKQNANRVLEPYMWHTVVVTSTDWANFYALRCDKDAQPEIRSAAKAMLRCHYNSTPKKLGWGDWHLPYLGEEEQVNLSVADQKKISTGRVARTSYLTHDGNRDFSKDIELHDALLRGGHMSPFGQVASPDPGLVSGSNLYRYRQYRKECANENNFANAFSREKLLLGIEDEALVDFVLASR